MRILFIISSLSHKFGGPAVNLMGLSRALSLRGHINKIITTDYLGREENDFLGKNIEVITLNAQKFIARNYAYGRNFKNTFLKEINSSDIVDINGLWQYPTFLAARLCQKENKPYIIRVYGMLESYGNVHKKIKKTVYHLLFEKHNLEKASFVQFTTEKELIKSKNYIGNAKTIVLPQGIEDLEKINKKDYSKMKQLEMLNGQKYIIYSGRLHPQKYIELLIKSFYVFSQKKDDIWLVLMGYGEKDYVKKLKRITRKLRIENKTIFLNNISSVERFEILRKAEVSCILSKEESFGLSIIESLYYKVPVIVRPTIDLADDISRIKCGCVSRGSPKEVSQCIEKIINSKALKKDMGERGSIWVKNNFIWDKLVLKYEKMYQEALM